MGRGKVWSSLEYKHLAEAWIAVSEDQDELDVKGTNQDGDAFWRRVLLLLGTKGSGEGIYGDRGEKAVKSGWQDTVARDCRKFSKSLVIVYASRPTGVGTDEMQNIAVAMHLKKAETASSRHKDFPCEEWKLWQAWCVLKEHRSFKPSCPQTAQNPLELDTEEEEEEVSNLATSSGTETDDVSSHVSSLKSPPAKPSARIGARGPGAGVKKSKAMAIDLEYKKKKQKMQADMLELSRKRHAAFEMHVNNMARSEAFKNALSAYNAFKDCDQERAEKYKVMMDSIMNGGEDSDDDMPPVGV